MQNLSITNDINLLETETHNFFPKVNTHYQAIILNSVIYLDTKEHLLRGFIGVPG